MFINDIISDSQRVTVVEEINNFNKIVPTPSQLATLGNLTDGEANATDDSYLVQEPLNTQNQAQKGIELLATAENHRRRNLAELDISGLEKEIIDWLGLGSRKIKEAFGLVKPSPLRPSNRKRGGPSLSRGLL
ncbi:hypothetical protein FNV43_RR04286 [Rhamnella rubrinervis]|uniref:Uncharacterized protein n=1 Tax=Rhamnella rubrinervis TaxID=2594499 RepID=A0A8K0MQG1_9ROSA|nr:hypothetical protein FNV43_RR04286 [Rhamnella rubrinervis]